MGMNPQNNPPDPYTFDLLLLNPCLRSLAQAANAALLRIGGLSKAREGEGREPR